MLYFIASPIGNLGDLTFRAKEVLGVVDYILSEDTRQTKKLLLRYDIDKRTVSFNEHSFSKIDGIIRDLKAGMNIALLSDAGTPGLCDPGGRLLEVLLREKLEFTSLPGPSALTTLVSMAPFPCSTFLFIGYFPKKKGREKTTSMIGGSEVPVFFFESPHRIKKTISLLSQKLPDRDILIGRELTKKFEEVIFKKLGDITQNEILDKGEFVLAVAPLAK